MWFFDETPYDRIFVKGPYSFYLAEAVAKLLAMKEIPSDFDLKSLYCAPTHLVLQKKKDAASGRRGKYGVELVKHEGNASLNFERKDVGTMRDGHFLIYVRFPSTASLLRLAELFLLSHSILYRAPWTRSAQRNHSTSEQFFQKIFSYLGAVSFSFFLLGNSESWLSDHCNGTPLTVHTQELGQLQKVYGALDQLTELLPPIFMKKGTLGIWKSWRNHFLPLINPPSRPLILFLTLLDYDTRRPREELVHGRDFVGVDMNTLLAVKVGQHDQTLYDKSEFNNICARYSKKALYSQDAVLRRLDWVSI